MPENTTELPGGVFGGKISDSTITQLDCRSTIHSKPAKSPMELAYLNANSPWILLRSSVNTPKGGVNDSKTYTLAGGTLYSSGNARSGVEPFSERPAYTKGSMGFRPKPGITSIEVKNKDTWGCISEATVNFSVWSLEDLNIIDKLYFKPGMTALLEWGHSMYVDNSGKVKKAEANTMVVSAEKFFNAGDFKSIDDLVKAQREKFNGNYEGMFGYITNFSYSFKKNGGYECTVKLLSKGAVLEGLTLQKANDEEEAKLPGIKKEDQPSNSVYHQILQWLQEHTGLSVTSYTGVGPQVIVPGSDEEVSYEDCTFYRKGIKTSGLFQKVMTGNKSFLFYTRLGDLLKLINSKEELTFKVLEHNGYVYFDKEFSLNPYIALLPQTGDLNINKDCKIKEIVPLRGTRGKIEDIIVNYTFFVSIIDQVIASKGSDYKILDVMDILLTSIQKAFGNINLFGIDADKSDESVFYIVDRDKPCNIADSKAQWPVINISGVGTTVRDLSVVSEISPELTKMVSISAAASESKPGDANYSFIHWTEGCKNRHIPTKDVSSNAIREVSIDYLYNIFYEPNSLDTFLKKAQEMYNTFSSNDNKNVSENLQNAYLNLQLTGESVFARCINELTNKKDSGIEMVQAGIIPIKLNLTFDGISGLIIGTMFRVTGGIVQSKYDDWKYIITGVTNKVDSHGWVTTITTQYCPILVPTETLKDKVNSPENKDKKVQGTVEITQASENKDGRQGDSQGNEVYTKRFKVPGDYLADGTWTLYRDMKGRGAKAASVAKTFALDNSIGYNQGNRNSLYINRVANNVGEQRTPFTMRLVDTDCSAFIYACYCSVDSSLKWYFDKNHNSPTTGTTNQIYNQQNGFLRVGTVSGDKWKTLQAGDILLKGGHIIMVTGGFMA